MRKTFERALKHVLIYEGGYTDHPLDPGGATNLGITRGVLSRFRGRRVSKAEVRAITKNEAAEIYERLYWDPCVCSLLPTGLDLAVFDCAVNQGVGRATRLLQKAARVKVDGRIGPKTMAAIKATDTLRLLNEFMARRMRHYGGLRRLFRTFGLGWSRRLMATYGKALQLIETKGVNS